MSHAIPHLPTQAAETSSAVDDKGDDGSGGLDWLAQAAIGSTARPATDKLEAPPATAATSQSGETPTEDGGLSWLTAAITPGGAQTKTTRVDDTAPYTNTVKRKKSSTAAAVSGGWMTSVKLGLGSGEGGMEDNDAVGKSTEDSAQGQNKPKKAKKDSPSVSASGPGGWLVSGGHEMFLDRESDVDDLEDGGGGSQAAVTVETQTEDDIEGIVKKAAAPKLPPWAKPWTPPPPPAEPAVAEATSGGEKDGKGSDQKVRAMSANIYMLERER